MDDVKYLFVGIVVYCHRLHTRLDTGNQCSSQSI